ncbi:MAG: putative component of type VI protein secretion system [Planctomycetota bacterium]|jgi:predicted component of type VI protein secretion system
MKRIAIPSAAALLMVFAGCSSMQPAANTTDIELVLETPPS